MSVRVLSSFIKFAKAFNIEITSKNLKKFKNLQKGEHIKNKCVGGVITR